jgi:hypothetical protein
MQVTINIPDSLFHDIEQSTDNIEASIIQALELYAKRKEILKNDPLYKWANTPAYDKDSKTDVSEDHDKYIYNL